jgi:hypothetical protein
VQGSRFMFTSQQLDPDCRWWRMQILPSWQQRRVLPPPPSLTAKTKHESKHASKHSQGQQTHPPHWSPLNTSIGNHVQNTCPPPKNNTPNRCRGRQRRLVPTSEKHLRQSPQKKHQKSVKIGRQRHLTEVDGSFISSDRLASTVPLIAHSISRGIWLVEASFCSAKYLRFIVEFQ